MAADGRVGRAELVRSPAANLDETGQKLGRSRLGSAVLKPDEPRASPLGARFITINRCCVQAAPVTVP